MCSHPHVLLHSYMCVLHVHVSMDTSKILDFFFPFLPQKVGIFLAEAGPQWWADGTLIDHMVMEIGRSSFSIMRIGRLPQRWKPGPIWRGKKMRAVCISREALCPLGTSLQCWFISSPYLPWKGHTDDSSECRASKIYIYIYLAWTKRCATSKGFSVLGTAQVAAVYWDVKWRCFAF